MPKTLKQREEHAANLTDHFENYEPRAQDWRDPQLSRTLEAAVRSRAETEREIANAVHAMRLDGSSWASIGILLGTTGQAAQQRYGREASAEPRV